MAPAAMPCSSRERPDPLSSPVEKIPSAFTAAKSNCRPLAWATSRCSAKHCFRRRTTCVNGPITRPKSNEAWDAIPWNAVISMRKGVRVAIKSDSDDLARRLNQEAAKTMRYGGATEEEALRMITLNPAWIIGVENRVGSIEVGKDADLVIWDGYPLSSYGVPEKVLIDGDVYFDRSLPGFGMPRYKEGE